MTCTSIVQNNRLTPWPCLPTFAPWALSTQRVNERLKREKNPAQMRRKTRDLGRSLQRTSRQIHTSYKAPCSPQSMAFVPTAPSWRAVEVPTWGSSQNHKASVFNSSDSHSQFNCSFCSSLLHTIYLAKSKGALGRTTSVFPKERQLGQTSWWCLTLGKQLISSDWWVIVIWEHLQQKTALRKAT